MFCQKLLATIIYINKNIPKVQPRLQGPVEANQPRYCTSFSMITRTKVQKLFFFKVVNTMEHVK